MVFNLIQSLIVDLELINMKTKSKKLSYSRIDIINTDVIAAPPKKKQVLAKKLVEFSFV